MGDVCSACHNEKSTPASSHPDSSGRDNSFACKLKQDMDSILLHARGRLGSEGSETETSEQKRTNRHGLPYDDDPVYDDPAYDDIPHGQG